MKASELITGVLITVAALVGLVRIIRHRQQASKPAFWLGMVFLPLALLFGVFESWAGWGEYQWHRFDRQRVALASMKSDLRNLMTAQEAFFEENHDFAGSVSPGKERNGRGGTGSLSFLTSPGNVLLLTYVDSAGWWATMTNPDLERLPVLPRGGKTCGIFVGDESLAPNPRAAVPATPGCW